MFLTETELLLRLRHHLEATERVSIASAWVGFGGAFSALQAYAERQPGSLQAIVGTSGTATHPRALRILQEVGELRLPGNTPLFHPKLILFHHKKGAIAWVGSANLTRCGFEQNTEVTVEIEDSDGSACRWFSQLWESLSQDCETALALYEKNWKPTGSQSGSLGIEILTPSEGDLWTLARELTDWESYVRALGAASLVRESQFGCTVGGEATSWLNTINLGMEITRRASWNNLSKVDYHVLLGVKDGNTDSIGYGLLGSMQGAGQAKNVFLEFSDANVRVREQIRSGLQTAIQASDVEFFQAAIDFIKLVSGLKGFGPAFATRCLALARPNLAVSVNRGSIPGLAVLSELPQNSLGKTPSGPRARSYADLLAFLARQDWYSNPTPNGRYEQTLANARGALLDCLVYVPTTGTLE